MATATDTVFILTLVAVDYEDSDEETIVFASREGAETYVQEKNFTPHPNYQYGGPVGTWVGEENGVTVWASVREKPFRA